jgi:DNA-binding response OmpR family regulator
MLVEDEESVRLLLRLTLEIGSIEIVEAPDGETAVATYLAERPDVVFLDWALPGRSGVEVCREIRDQQTEDTTIIMLTARTGEEQRREGLAAGADDYISKPFSPEHLLDKLREILGPRALLGET